MRWGFDPLHSFSVDNGCGAGAGGACLFPVRPRDVRFARSDPTATRSSSQLRSGGDIHCDKSLIVKVEPDEVEYPEEVLQALPLRESRPDRAGRRFPSSTATS